MRLLAWACYRSLLLVCFAAAPQGDTGRDRATLDEIVSRLGSQLIFLPSWAALRDS